jgi:hypothetical protein
VINHYVETQYLKAHVVREVVRMHRRYTVAQSRITRDNRLYEDVVYLRLQLLHIVTLIRYMLVN